MVHSNTAVSRVKINVVNRVTCLSIFTSLKPLNDAFEAQFFQGFIFTPYQRH